MASFKQIMAKNATKAMAVKLSSTMMGIPLAELGNTAIAKPIANLLGVVAMALSIRAKRATTATTTMATVVRPIVNRSNWAGRAQMKDNLAKNSPVAMDHSNPIWANNATMETSYKATVALTAASKPVGCVEIQTHHVQKSFAKIKVNTANASKSSMATAKSTKISKIATTATKTITTDVRKASSIWAGFAQSLENLAVQRLVAMAYSPATKNATTATTTMATVARRVVG